MFNNLSLPSSLSGILHSTYNTMNASTINQGTQANFEDYLMNALNQKDKTKSTNSTALFDLLSNSGSTSLLNGLNSTASTNEFASMLIQNLQQPTTDQFSLTGFENGNNSLTNSYATGLMNHFEAQMLNQMNAAKSKLQTSYSNYVDRAGEKPTAAAKLRIEQMQQNISQMEQFIQSKSTNASRANNTDPLIEQLNVNASRTQSYLKL